MTMDISALWVPKRYINSILASAVGRGLDSDILLKQARIAPDTLLQARARFSLIQYSRLYGAIALALDDEGVGLHTRQTPLGAIETLCRAGMSATTLDECLYVLSRALSSVLGDFQVTYERATETTPPALLFSERTALKGDRALVYEVGLLTTYGLIVWLFGRRVPLVSVSLPFAEPRYAFGLRMLSVEKVALGPVARLAFAPSALSMRVARSPAEISRWVRRTPASIVETLAERAELSSQIISLFQESPQQLPTLQEVAVMMAMSPRTLHRKLIEQGESFQQIKDRWRFRIAMQQLSCTENSVKQIAAELGFSDQATFRRAFSNWAGKPPGAYRRGAA